MKNDFPRIWTMMGKKVVKRVPKLGFLHHNDENVTAIISRGLSELQKALCIECRPFIHRSIDIGYFGVAKGT